MMDPPVKPGEMLAGKYRVEKILGTGAMAPTSCRRGRRICSPPSPPR